jgi:hypothetical protein
VKIKDVPEKAVLARIEGNWQDKIYYTLGSKPFAKVAVSYTKCFSDYIDLTLCRRRT